ncbi:MAG: isopentenyl-diphosphate Delta-isomerase [Filifactoraceae bacterium]
MDEQLILVDSFDNEIGSASKHEAHEKALLHRAFSVFIVNEGKMLIQKRAYHKYHSGGLWANACCSHPRLGESLEEAVPRRMYEELGFSQNVKKLFTFTYFHKYSEEMYEYEYDHVFLGEYEGIIIINSDEIAEIRWIEFDNLEKEMRRFPNQFSAWFHIAAPKVMEVLRKEKLE